MFAVRTLLTLVGIVLIECVAATMALGFSAGLCLLGSLIAFRQAILEVFIFVACWSAWGSHNPTFGPTILARIQSNCTARDLEKARLSRRRGNLLMAFRRMAEINPDRCQKADRSLRC
jgi:hypothetical protein